MIKSKKQIKLRNEKKHYINQVDGFELSQRLKHLFRYDNNANSRGFYRVSSLYFDTPYDKALRQKIDGIDRREKFRIRYYNDDLSFIRLERKIKINGKCSKQTAQLTKTEVEKIIEGSIDFLLKKDDPLCIEFYSKIKGQLLRAKTVVVYDREAFIYEPGNVRITIDKNLRTTMNPYSFLNTDAYSIDLSEGLSILEVKYDEFLPEVVRLAVQLKNRSITAYSKYAVSRKYD